ncbi:MAG: hypothetical protein AAF892_14120 [Cyanobacteria bacterium P01_D01_bin.71]
MAIGDPKFEIGAGLKSSLLNGSATGLTNSATLKLLPICPLLQQVELRYQ